MRICYLRAVSLLAVAVGLTLPSAIGKVLGADKEVAAAADSKAEGKADAKADAKDAGKAKGGRKEAAGRLPAFYADVVDGEQREKIYAIQAEHEPAIKGLQAALKEAMAKRDAAVAAVLSPAQQEKVAKLQAEAKQKRATKEKASMDENDATASTVSGKTPAKKAGEADGPKSDKEK